MLGKYKFTDKEIKVLLDSLTVIIDTREQENSHITEYLKKKKIPYKGQKLDFGDYSFMIPANPLLQIPRDIYYTDSIVVERKKDIIEVIGNLCEDGGNRLENEFIRSRGSKFYFMIENTTYLQAIRGNYEISPGKKSKYKAETLIDRIKTFEARYGIVVHWGGDQISSGNYIYYTFRRWLREQIKGGDIIDTTALPLPNLPEQ
jgi:hypothetical protein